MSDDPWASSDVDTPAQLKAVTPGEGVPFRESLAPDWLLRAAIGLVTEMLPVMAVYAAVSFVLSLLPALIRIPVSVFLTMSQTNGDIDDMTVQIIDNGVNLGVLVMLSPFGFLIAAGMAGAVRSHIEGDAASIGQLFGHAREAIAALLTFVVVELIMTPLTLPMLACLGVLLVGVAAAMGIPLDEFDIPVSSEALQVAGLVCGLLVIPLALLLWWVRLGFAFALPASYVDGLSPMAAIRGSWTGMGLLDRLILVAYSLVAGLLIGLPSLFTCGLWGLVVSPLVAPVTAGVSALCWLAYARPRSELKKLRFFREHTLA